jgi:hypothetical protein
MFVIWRNTSQLSPVGFSTWQTVCTSFVIRLDLNLNSLYLLLTLMREIKFDMKDSNILISKVCKNWPLRTWLLVCRRCFLLKESIRDVFLGRIIRNHLNLGKHFKDRTFLNWFTMMSYASIYLHWQVQGTFLLSLMIYLVSHGSFSWRIRTFSLKS